jgi:EpsG family
MWPYWLIFTLPAWLAVTRLRPVQGPAVSWSGYWQFAFVLLVLMIGLRHEVGGDWGNDWNDFAVRTIDDSWMEALSIGDPAYSLTIWLVRLLGLDIHTLDLLSAVPFTFGLLVFCRHQPRPWLAMTVAVPYLVIVVAMGYTRQSVAIGLSMCGIIALQQGRILSFALWIAWAATFHKSAIILVPLAQLADSRRGLFMILWVCVVTILLWLLLLQDSLDRLIVNYIGAEYNSQGAGIRIAMNAWPAMLYLLLRRRFMNPKRDRKFWTWMSLAAIGFIGLFAVSPSSTAVDRVALYWIPLQLFVLSRLPDAIGYPGEKNALGVYIVVAYSAAVQFVWLFFAATNYMWVPYQFYPWVWLWE